MSDSDYEDYEEFHESIYERIVALQDALPVFSIAKWVGSALWIGVTAASISLLPFAIELEKESAALSQGAMESSAKEAIEGVTAEGGPVISAK